MNQAVHAADIGKRTEIGDAAHNAFNMLARFKLVVFFLARTNRFFLQYLTAGSHDAATGFVHFQRLHRYLFPNKLFQVFHIAVGKLGSRDKHSGASVFSQNACFYGLFDGHFKFAAVFQFRNGGSVSFSALDGFTAQQYVAFTIVHFHDFHRDLIAHSGNVRSRGFGIQRQFRLRNDAVRFIADVYKNIVAHDLHHGSLFHLARANAYHGLLQIALERFFGCQFTLWFLGRLFSLYAGFFGFGRLGCNRCFGFGLRLFHRCLFFYNSGVQILFIHSGNYLPD